MRDGVPGLEVELAVGGTNTARRTIPLRHSVEPGTRTHFVFEIEAPPVARAITLRLALRASRGGWAFRRPRVELATVRIAVRTADPEAHVP